MSFIGNVEQGKAYAAGYFLAHEECERKTREISQTGATTASDGSKYVKAGTILWKRQLEKYNMTELGNIHAHIWKLLCRELCPNP